MHEHTLAPSTQKLFDKLAQNSWVSDFYLAGGTALALHLGHRISVDLDFFNKQDFNEALIISKLSDIGKLEVFQKSLQSITGSVDDVKVSFLGYKYPLLKPGTKLKDIALASVEDIACMKLDALSSRGTKRDFIDLYFIAKVIPLSVIFEMFEKKYALIKYNMLHIKKSLTYFIDAEDDPMPKMIVPVTWNEVKDYFTEQVMDL